MAKTEDVEKIAALTKLRDKRTVLTGLNKMNTGIVGVLRCLYRAEPGVILTAGDISNLLGITSARTAAVLNKMEGLDLIKRNKMNEDARKVNIILTEKGNDVCIKLRRKYLQMISESIDIIGIERMTEFVKTVNELCDKLPNHDLSWVITKIE